MSQNYHIAVLPGDGIGPEVMKQAYKVLDVIRQKYNLSITTSYLLTCALLVFIKV